MTYTWVLTCSVSLTICLYRTKWCRQSAVASDIRHEANYQYCSSLEAELVTVYIPLSAAKCHNNFRPVQSSIERSAILQDLSGSVPIEYIYLGLSSTIWLFITTTYHISIWLVNHILVLLFYSVVRPSISALGFPSLPVKWRQIIDEKTYGSMKESGLLDDKTGKWMCATMHVW